MKNGAYVVAHSTSVLLSISGDLLVAYPHTLKTSWDFKRCNFSKSCPDETEYNIYILTPMIVKREGSLTLEIATFCVNPSL